MNRQKRSDFFAVHGATKNFGALKAVDNISFHVNEGEIFGIAGPNGSGKSTLFNIISSIPFPADAGRIVFNGNDITRMPPHQICRMGLTRTFQRETTFPGLSAFDNVLVAIEHSKTAAGQRENEMLSEQALDIVGFPKTMHNIPAETLPLFNRKQLMLAGALAFSPRLILLDEPASSLTKPEIEKLKKIIIRINQGGVSILLIEHVLALLIDVSQRLLILNHGKMLSMGEPDKVIKEASVIEAYLGNQGKENATTS